MASPQPQLQNKWLRSQISSSTWSHQHTQKQRRSTTEHSEVVLAEENPKALP
jgi:hypothetical protein